MSNGTPDRQGHEGPAPSPAELAAVTSTIETRVGSILLDAVREAMREARITTEGQTGYSAENTIAHNALENVLKTKLEEMAERGVVAKESVDLIAKLLSGALLLPEEVKKKD